MGSQIFLVDDDPTILNLLELLGRSGFEVATATSARLALQRLDEGAPDLFVLDWMIPDMSGLELCAHLRSEPATAHTPVVILTGRSDSDSERQNLAASANAYSTPMSHLRPQTS